MAPPFDSQVGEHNSSNCWTYGRYIELVHGPTSHLITGGKHHITTWFLNSYTVVSPITNHPQWRFMKLDHGIPSFGIMPKIRQSQCVQIKYEENGDKVKGKIELCIAN